MIVHVAAALALMPVAGHPYDLASLTSASGAWLRWGVPLFYQWKFGFDLSVVAVGSQSLSYVLEHLGMSGAAALAVAWKLPLVLADLLVGVILLDIGRQLRCQRPGLVPALWLISPVPLWVSAGHGQIESLTILAIVASLDMLLRHRPLLAGIVVGLGIGIEYLPVLVALIAIFWLYVAVIGRREAYRFAAGCAGAVAFCFGPPLASDVGRMSLLGGLSFSASVASHPGHTRAAGPIASSLWAVFDLSPGPLWLAAASLAAATLLIVLARKARKAGGTADPRRLGILAAGGLLLCVTLFDPGSLPQFSVLVLAGLCIVGLCLDLSPAVIILGPSLQLATGLLFVYGGSFQSFWYDMWATTGTSGWPFPQSLLAADLAARAGAMVIALGLLVAPSHVLGARLPARLRIVVARSSIAAGALAAAFLATWSSQPAFWQGAGSQGPSTLADFPIITAFQPGKLSITPQRALITLSPQEVLGARESAISPSLTLTVTAHPLYAQTMANTTIFGHSIVQMLTIPGWAHEQAEVHSLWISALIGKPAWRSQEKVLGGVPALVVRDRPISSSEATWVAPGWAVVTYDVPASMVSAQGHLKLGMRVSQGSGDVIGWNGNPHVRWVLASLHSGAATATIDGRRWHGPVTVPSPTPSWWYQRTEEASIQVAEASIWRVPNPSVSITGVAIGGQAVAINGGGLSWPSSGALDRTIHGPLLSVLGVADAAALLGGTLMLGRRVAGARAPRVRSGGHSRGRHRAAGPLHAGTLPGRLLNEQLTGSGTTAPAGQPEKRRDDHPLSA